MPLQKKEGSGVRDFGFGCCRKEVCADSLAEIGRVCSLEQVLEPDVRGLFLPFVFHASEVSASCLSIGSPSLIID